MNVFSLFNSVISTPASYTLTNVTGSSQFAAVNPDNYLFWDGLHPTVAGHRLLALNALALIAPTSTSTTLTSSNPTAILGASIAFTASVSSSGGSPTGVVNFYDGAAAIGNAQLVNGIATFTTTSLAAGTHNISASYVATQYFNASNSNTLAEVITSPFVTAGVTPVGLSVATGSSGSATVSVTTGGGFSGTVTLGCGPLPSSLSCTFSPSSLVFAGANSTLTSALTVNTNGPRIASLQPVRHTASSLQAITACSLLPLFGFLAFRRKGARGIILMTLLLLLSFGAVTGLSGCSSSPVTGANTGNYTIPVIVTSSTGSSTISFQLTITN